MSARPRPFVRAAFDITRNLVVICDPYGRIILINRAMEHFTGLDCLGVVPGVWSAYGELFHLDGGPVADTTAPMARALRGETVRNDEMVLGWPRVLQAGRAMGNAEPQFERGAGP